MLKSIACAGGKPHIFTVLNSSALTPPASGNLRPGPQFSFIDLFAGIGGLRLAFEAHGGQCVFTSEWNEFSLKTYRANFTHAHQIAGDITRVNPHDIPDHDVLLAGFPCQPFSLAGVSKKNALGREHGFRCKTQGTLFFNLAEIIECKRPRAFLLENVRHLLRHDAGRTFQVIRETLETQLGYELHVKVIDAKAFVPQHRERVYLVGFDGKTGFDWNAFTAPPCAPALDAILHPEDGTEAPEEPYTKGRLARVSEKYTLSDKLWKYLQDYAAKHRAAGNGFGCSVFTRADTARTLSARYHKDGSEILIAQKGRNPRRLTPRECSRLMGFDHKGRVFKIPVSDSQAYRQFGNSVVVPVVQEIARIMLPHLHALQRRD